MTGTMANATTLFAGGKCSKEGSVKSFLRPLQKREFSGEQLRHRVVEMGWCKKSSGTLHNTCLYGKTSCTLRWLS